LFDCTSKFLQTSIIKAFCFRFTESKPDKTESSNQYILPFYDSILFLFTGKALNNVFTIFLFAKTLLYKNKLWFPVASQEAK
jgi:hypothetical protein